MSETECVINLFQLYVKHWNLDGNTDGINWSLSLVHHDFEGPGSIPTKGRTYKLQFSATKETLWSVPNSLCSVRTTFPKYPPNKHRDCSTRIRTLVEIWTLETRGSRLSGRAVSCMRFTCHRFKVDHCLWIEVLLSLRRPQKKVKRFVWRIELLS